MVQQGARARRYKWGAALLRCLLHHLNWIATIRAFLLSCGVAAGFGAVFGTPLAGAIFALEVLAIGKMRYDALIPCLMASVIGDWVCTSWGIGHTQYQIVAPELHIDAVVAHVSPLLAAKVMLASVLFGLAGFLFAELTHLFSRVF